MYLGKYFVPQMLSRGNASIGISQETLSSVIHQVRKLPRATTNVQKNKSYVGLFISYVGLVISYVGLIKSYVGLYNSYVGDKIS